MSTIWCVDEYLDDEMGEEGEPLEDDDAHLDRAGDADEVRKSRILVGILCVCILLMGFASVKLSARSPYMELSSGPAIPIGGQVTGGGAAASNGSSKAISFTTVDAQSLSWGSYLEKKYLEGDGANIVEAGPISSAVGDDAAAMAQAKQDAGLVALYMVRGKWDTRVDGVIVSQVVANGAAKGKLEVGDILLSIDGKSISSFDVLSSGVQASEGRSVRLIFSRGGQRMSASIAPTRLGGVGTPYKIGIAGSPRVVLASGTKLPSVPTGDVEGPSGGLMFTLAMIDAMSPGQLIPMPLAGTGTIDASGAVGPIGGIEYKVAGAKAGGAKVFFAPQLDAVDARGAARGGIQVVSVRDISTALLWLCSHGATDKICTDPGLIRNRAAQLASTNPPAR